MNLQQIMLHSIDWLNDFCQMCQCHLHFYWRTLYMYHALNQIAGYSLFCFVLLFVLLSFCCFAFVFFLIFLVIFSFWFVCFLLCIFFFSSTNTHIYTILVHCRSIWVICVWGLETREKARLKGEALPSLFPRFAPNTHTMYLPICFDSAHVLYLSCNSKS